MRSMRRRFATSYTRRRLPVAMLAADRTLYSQNDEELIVRGWFGDRRGGVFVDVGAGDWRIDSTTYYLERHLGWSGIAVDARSGLEEGFENRPGTRFHRYLVGDESGRHAVFYEAGWLSTTDRRHLEAHEIDPAFIRHTTVPTITLTELLDAEGVRRIDFLSMDVELGESAVLRGFDIGRFRPELVCIEAHPSQHCSMLEYFERHDYRRLDGYLAHDAVNWWFAPVDALASR